MPADSADIEREVTVNRTFDTPRGPARGRLAAVGLALAAMLLTLLGGAPTASAAVTDTLSGTAGGGGAANWRVHPITVAETPGPFRTITLTWDNAATDLNLGLLTSSGTAVQWSATTTGTSEVVARDIPPGDYRLAVSTKTGSATSYTVTIDDAQPAPPPPCDGTFCGTVMAGAGTNWRSHAIDLTAGEPAQVSLNWADAAASLQVGVQNPNNGTWIAWGRGTDPVTRPQTVSFTPTVTGRHTIAVSAKSGPETAYSVTVLKGNDVPPPEPPAGAVGTYASAFGFGPKDVGHAGLYAYGVEWDATSSTLLVGDVWNHRILRYTPDGQRITSFAITSAGDRGQIEPFDVETGPDGKIYSTSEGYNRIDVWQSDGTYVRSIGLNGSNGSNGGKGCGNGAVTWPSHLAVTGGKLYASDGSCGDIFVFDAQTGAFLNAFGIPAIAKTAFGVNKVVARGLEADQDGNLAFVDHASRRIAKFTPDGVLLPGWPTAPEPTMMDPRGLSVDLTTGDIYVAAALQNQLYRYSSTGQLELRLRAPQGGSFNTIRYVSATNGEVYVGDTWGHRVWRLTPDGAQLPWAEPAQLPPNGGFNQISGLAVDSGSGRLFSNDTYENRVQGFATRTSSGVLSKCPTAADCPAWLSSFGHRAVNSPNNDGLNYPRALAAGGGFVFSDAGTSIVRYDLDGNFLNRWGTWGSGPSQFITGPTGIDVVPTDATSGKVYTVDLGTCRIMVTDYQGRFLDQMGSCGTGVNQMRSPWQIDVVGNKAYVAESGRAQVAVWDLTTKQVVQTIRGTAADLVIKEPRGVQVDPSGTWVYIADTGNKRVIRVSVADPSQRQLVTAGVDTPEKFLNFPRYLTFDAAGTLYVGDFNQRIYAFTVPAT
jgi:sugar lactone lactonase YvrE